MNKAEVNEMLPKAYELLKKHNIVKNNKINKSWYGQISVFGSAISTGSLLSAIAFFSDNGSCSVDRQNLLRVIFDLIKDDLIIDNNPPKKLFDLARINMGENELMVKESIINATIATKLAMKLYELTDEKAWYYEWTNKIQF